MSLASVTQNVTEKMHQLSESLPAVHNPLEAEHVNVGQVERVVSGLGGLGLALYGYRRGGVLGTGLAALGGLMAYRALSGHCNLYQAAGLNTASRGGQPASPREYHERGIHVEETLTIDKPREDLYRYWRHFPNLPRFMDHLESVSVTGDKTSHWVAKGPAGRSVAWDAEIINEESGRLIAWRSLAEADVDNTGSVRFLDTPNGRGTEVKVALDYIPPAGRVGSAVAWLFGEEPSVQVRDDLRRFKQLMETGEVATPERQPADAERRA